MARIGFIGLGNMGLPMAQNLIKAGHAVTGFDAAKAAVGRLSAADGAAATSIAEVCAGAEIVITMLPAAAQVREVYTAPRGVIASVAPGTLLVDSSTIDVATARTVAAAAQARGLGAIDAPVSGGVAGAQAATLTFMVGGSEGDFARAKPILESMGRTIVHAGGSGNGQAAKICNNMILGVSMIAVCEAFVLAEKLGLDPQKLFDIASKSSGQCWSLTSYCPVPGPVPASPANRDYQAGFTAAMMLKDLKLSQQAAQAAGSETPMGAEAAKLYERYCVQGGESGKDFSGIIRLLRSAS